MNFQGNRINFDAEDEAKMASAATWGQIVAVCTLLTGVIGLLTSFAAGFEDTIAALFAAAIHAGLGVSLYMASTAFRRVATTDEDDHGHLLNGFRHLRTYFAVQGILLIIGLALAGLGLACGLGMAML